MYAPLCLSVMSVRIVDVSPRGRAQSGRVGPAINEEVVYTEDSTISSLSDRIFR
jgi:hypothetical protein